MAPVLKTGVPKGTVGSNPTPSVSASKDGRQQDPRLDADLRLMLKVAWQKRDEE